MQPLIYSIAKIKFQRGDDLDNFVANFVTETYKKFDENGDQKLSFEEFHKAATDNDEVKSFFTLNAAQLG